MVNFCLVGSMYNISTRNYHDDDNDYDDDGGGD